MLTAYDIYDNYRLEGFKSQTIDNVLKLYPYAIFTKRNNYYAIRAWLVNNKIKEYDFIGSREPDGTIWFFADEANAIAFGLKWM
jgi:hypothetical protein